MLGVLLNRTAHVGLRACRHLNPLPNVLIAGLGHENSLLVTSWLPQCHSRHFSEAADSWLSLKESFTSVLADVDSSSGVATITINRPESLNALNTKVGPGRS